MVRRLHVSRVTVGELTLDSAEAHHALRVLRLPAGTSVEVFDDGGTVAGGVLILRGHDGAAVRVEAVNPPAPAGPRLIIVSAVPKGDRADWMVEKLTEIGVAEFVPLAAARSVVLPRGAGKRQRWMRIATEAAKQSRRNGVMSITPLTPLHVAIAHAEGSGGFLSTEPAAFPFQNAFMDITSRKRMTLFIGPEGGWTDQEAARFAEAKLIPLRLTRTILRTETAAILAAAGILARD